MERELRIFKIMTKYLTKNRGQSVLHKREATKKETKEKIQAEVLKKVDKLINILRNSSQRDFKTIRLV